MVAIHLQSVINLNLHGSEEIYASCYEITQELIPSKKKRQDKSI